jgi:hypothetical protein
VPPLAAKVAEYVVPTVALGREDVVITKDAADTEIESVADAVCAVGVVLSVTCTVNVKLPCVLVVPVIAPDDERIRPGGNEPLVMIHE